MSYVPSVDGAHDDGGVMSADTHAAVDSSNAEQARAWDGDQGTYWARHADRFDEIAAPYHGRLLEAATIAPNEVVLDVGCGTGQLTRDTARLASSGSVLGVDLSSPMLALARARAAEEKLTNVSFEQADAQVHPFPDGGFDLVISRLGVMFFGDPVAGFSNLARSLRPGGRMALLAWQRLDRNQWVSELRAVMAAGRELPTPPPDAPGPFALSDPDRVRGLLTEAGLQDISLESVEEPVTFGRDAEHACEFVAGMWSSLLDDLDDSTRARALDELRALMAEYVTEDGVRFGAAGWLIRARR